MLQRLFNVLHPLSLVVMLFALAMLLPIGVSLAMEGPALYAFDETVLATGSGGLLIWALTRGRRGELQVRDGFLLVVLVWATLPAIAALPMHIYIPGLSFTDAYFEAVSGLTASGATLLSGLDHLPPSINVWRAELMWIGGMGLIVLAVAILPLLGVGGRQIFKAETPGPMKESKLTPRIAETAKGLWLVYAAITVACALAYRAAGMSWLDALIHSFTTMGLGGFSSHDASFGYFDSPAIEAVAMFFMLVAGLNFATHFLAWRSRSAAPYRHDPEVSMFLGVVLGSSLLVATYLWHSGTYPDFATALRYASFNTISVATTTGYASTDYAQWPIFAPLWIVFLSSFASSSGSTGGGIKMIRAMLLYKQVFREMLRTIHPSAVAPVKLRNRPVAESIIHAVLAFMFIYVVCLVSFTLVLAATGLDALTAFSAAAACLNNLGPGLGGVGPASTYAGFTDLQTWICTLAMLLGRLELFTLLIVLNPAFWRK